VVCRRPRDSVDGLSDRRLHASGSPHGPLFLRQPRIAFRQGSSKTAPAFLVCGSAGVGPSPWRNREDPSTKPTLLFKKSAGTRAANRPTYIESGVSTEIGVYQLPSAGGPIR